MCDYAQLCATRGDFVHLQAISGPRIGLFFPTFPVNITRFSTFHRSLFLIVYVFSLPTEFQRIWAKHSYQVLTWYANVSSHAAILFCGNTDKRFKFALILMFRHLLLPGIRLNRSVVEDTWRFFFCSDRRNNAFKISPRSMKNIIIGNISA